METGLIPQRGTTLAILACVLFLSAVAGAQQAAAGGDIHGVVKSGGQPLPGVAITAANTLTGQKVVTSTDVDGSYSVHVPSNGRYVLRAQITAFAPATKEIVINAASPNAQVDVEMVLASRARQPGEDPVAQAMGPTVPGRGFQSLGLNQGEGGTEPNGGNEQVVPQGMPVPGMSADAATESVAVSGNASPQDFASMSSEEIQRRVQEYRDQRGGAGGPGFAGGPPGGFGGGPPMIAMGGRGRGRFDFNKPHGMVYYSASDSVFDAAPYSFRPVATEQPQYMQNRFGFSLGGPLNIPHVYKSGNKTFFFFNYNGARGENPYDSYSTVPTLLERQGNFSQTHYLNGPNSGQLVQIFDPVTHTQFPGNMIGSIDPAAAQLLQFIPQPNLPGEVQNFHFTTAATNDTNDLNIRLVHSLGGAALGPRRGGRRNNISIGFHYHSVNSDLTNPFPSVGGNTHTRSFDVPVGYVKSFGKLINNFRLDFNRNEITTRNLYAFAQNIVGMAGITGVSQDPFDWGLPNLLFTNFQGVNDFNPLRRRDQTFTISDTLIWTHKKHTIRWGGDFRRIRLNTQTDSNARGSFTFTGLSTANVVGGIAQPGTGWDFADFLLGLPQQTSAQFGDNNYHFRGNSWDLFVMDEWRVRGNLTLNLGLRYEYVSPYTEINGLIATLDINPTFTAVAPVVPLNSACVGGMLGNASCQVGPYTGFFPQTLVNPDRNNFAPRLGIAWKPFNKTVVRAGYGINYNTGQYGTMAQNLAFQPPFSNNQNNRISPGSPPSLTLVNGFPPLPPTNITNGYAIDKDYRLGYVQIWNLDVQRELRSDLVLNLDYTGTKGTHLDIVDDPNRTATGLLIPTANPYLFELSGGNSTAHAGSVRLRKRLRQGISIGGTYTFSKSIDNASTIGGGAAVVAQNAFDLAAQRGLSSFNQAHRFTADYLWELPFGHDRRWLSHPGALRSAFGDWQWSGDWTIASGTPLTVIANGDFTDVARGSNGSLWANYTGQPIFVAGLPPGVWFNPAAFAAPPSGTFGDTGRNIFSGPGMVVFDMAMTKMVPITDTKTLELRVQANNVFNTPQFTTVDTNVNDGLQFGHITGAASMRKLQMLARFRF